MPLAPRPTAGSSPPGGRPRGAGFTLVELLVVITILGILAAVVVAAVSGLGDKGEAAARQSDATILATAQEAACARSDDPETGGYADIPQLRARGLLGGTSEYNDIDLDPPGGGPVCGAHSYTIWTPQRTQYPVTVVGCAGQPVVFAAAPRRPLTLDPAAYELLLHLGLDEIQLAARPWAPGARPARFAQSAEENLQRNPVAGRENYSEVPSSGYLPADQQLLANPDVVLAVDPGAFAEGAGGYGEAEFNNPLGPDGAEGGVGPIGTYLGFSLGPCDAGGAQTQAANPVVPRRTFEGVYDDLRNLGIVFDVQERALEVISEAKAAVAEAIAKAAPGRDRRVWVSGSAPTANPTAFGTATLAHALIVQLGARNAFDDRAGIEAVSREEIRQRRPDVVAASGYLADRGCLAVTGEIEGVAAFAELPAVLEQRFACVPLTSIGLGGVRLATEGIGSLAEALAESR